jgi:hypothetical protein
MGKRKEKRVQDGGEPCQGGCGSCGCNEATMESDNLPQGVKPLDIQVGGDHYKSLKIQPVEYILANDIPYVEGNIIKYITRWKQKGGVEDIKKVIHYAEILLEANS